MCIGYGFHVDCAFWKFLAETDDHRQVPTAQGKGFTFTPPASARLRFIRAHPPDPTCPLQDDLLDALRHPAFITFTVSRLCPKKCRESQQKIPRKGLRSPVPRHSARSGFTYETQLFRSLSPRIMLSSASRLWPAQTKVASDLSWRSTFRILGPSRRNRATSTQCISLRGLSTARLRE